MKTNIYWQNVGHSEQYNTHIFPYKAAWESSLGIIYNVSISIRTKGEISQSDAITSRSNY